MSKTELVSIRVPKGLPQELRQITGLPFNRIASTILTHFLNNERRKIAEEQKKLQDMQLPPADA